MTRAEVTFDVASALLLVLWLVLRAAELPTAALAAGVAAAVTGAVALVLAIREWWHADYSGPV